MNKIKKVLVLVLALVFAFILVGCNKEEPVKEPDPIAPTAVTIDATIYSGSENEKYVVKDSKMYIEAEFEGPEGFDEGLDWTIDGNNATLEVEDGVAVVTGVRAGNAVVTATSKIDANVKAQYTVEIVESEDFNTAVVDAKDAIAAALPTYVTADFTLPQPENPNIKVDYVSQLKKPWADGVFKFSDAYDASKGDIPYAFYGTFSFHGVKKEFEFSVKCVGDAIDNDFYALSAAKDQVEAMFEEKNISSSFKDIVDNADGTYSINLPTSITVEGCSQPVAIEWAVESGSGLSIKNKNQLLYTKPLADSQCQVNAIYKAKTNNDISKLYLTACGYTADEVWAYFKTSNYKASYYNAATDTFGFTTAGFTVPTTDTSKKFKLVTVEYEVLEESSGLLTYTAPSGSSSSGTFRKVAAGAAKVKVTIYYDKKVRTAMVDKLDENGNVVRKEDGTVEQVEEQQIVCVWSKEYEITINVG
ncbi:MAG: hypothetical protein K6E74_03500 [Bacilli bacterium]|nr:hypothetical protein [Bacilli bacterium]